MGRKPKKESKFFMDYFDFSGSIFLQKEITANADKDFPGSGKNNSNNQKQVSPTKETKEKEHRILTKIKTEMVQ